MSLQLGLHWRLHREETDNSNLRSYVRMGHVEGGGAYKFIMIILCFEADIVLHNYVYNTYILYITIVGSNNMFLSYMMRSIVTRYHND